MITKAVTFPFYLRATILLVGLLALVAFLYLAQRIIVPIVFATIVAILLQPVVNIFVRIKLNRIIAITITLVLTFLVIAAFFALLFSQVSRFSESWPLLVDRFTIILNQSITWYSGYFEINPKRIHEWIADSREELISSSTSAIGHTLYTIGSGLIVVFLVPVYIFMILYYQPLLLDFIHRLFNESHQCQVAEIVTKIKGVIQRYLTGLIIEAVMIAVLDATALFIIGIDYAILLGIIGAVLNVIPYLGGIIAVALPMMIAIATKATVWPAFYVLAAYYFIQMVDNHYIVPVIVSSKVKINALFSVIVVIAGNALWGISGMFLSIPLLAIVKLIFDHIGPLKPWGFLLGDTMPELITFKPAGKKLKL